MRRTRMFLVLLLAVPVIGVAAPAQAHVLLDAVEPRGDGTVDLVFTFDHGCQGQVATDGLVLTIPEHTAVVAASEPPGWTHETTDDTITWSGPGIAEGTDAEFVVTARVGAMPGETVLFPVTQSCTGAEPYVWDDPADGDPEPAPRFVATSATVDASLQVVPEVVTTSGAGGTAVAVSVAVFAAAAAALAVVVRRRPGA